MNEQNYTPGPWVIHGAMNSDRVHIGNPKEGHTLQGGRDSVCVVQLKEGESAFNQGEGTANAKLIAAAPDLVEALRFVRNSMIERGYHLQSACVVEIDRALTRAGVPQ